MAVGQINSRLHPKKGINFVQTLWAVQESFLHVLFTVSYNFVTWMATFGLEIAFQRVVLFNAKSKAARHCENVIDFVLSRISCSFYDFDLICLQASGNRDLEKDVHLKIQTI